MTKMTDDSIGLDISKDHLDACRFGDGGQARFANTEAGIAALRAWAGTPARLVYEATGPYHARLERELAGHLPLVKVNPWQARRFAEGCGQRAKTDPIDAAGLARMGAALALEPDRPLPRYLRELKELRLARQGLVRDRIALMNRLGQLTLVLTRRIARDRIA